MKFLVASLVLLLLSACATEPSKPGRLLAPVSFSKLSGWDSDNQADALFAFRRSCDKLQHKNDWEKPCAALANVPDKNNQAAREYFEAWFQPYAVSDNGNDKGLFTGYYEAALNGSLQQHDKYQTPIYTRPTDLIAVDLGEFKPEWKGKRLFGKVVGQNLKLYDDRASIVKGSLKERTQVIAWVDDPVGAFFLAVQGSGRIALENDIQMNVGYDGANGRDYVAIGRKLADSGELPKPVTMQSIRNWINAHPDRADDIMNANPSYIFFRILEDGPIGAQGVVLTPRRSLAVDPTYMTLGTPVWLETTDPSNAPLHRLMIAQDTGGAIKGVVRGDFFWGFGSEAEAKAGAMQNEGRYFVLLPKTAKANVEG